MDTLKQLIDYYQTNGSYVMEEFWRHFLMSAYGVIFAKNHSDTAWSIYCKKKTLSWLGYPNR